MTALPPALAQAFHMTAAELGMCSAAWLFVRELAAAGGDDLVRAAGDRLGREFPVFDCIAGAFLGGEREPLVDPEPALAALAGITRVLVVGLETEFLDALMPRLERVEVGLVTESGGAPPDWRRVLANYGGHIQPAGLSEIHAWAGRRCALLTFVYGCDGHTAHVAAPWLRVSGPDVRAQFRSLVGWDILGRPMSTYPRWLVPTSRDDFSHLVGT